MSSLEESQYTSVNQETSDSDSEERRTTTSNYLPLLSGSKSQFSSCDEGDLSDAEEEKKTLSEGSSTNEIFIQECDSKFSVEDPRLMLDILPKKRRSDCSALDFNKKMKIFKGAEEFDDSFDNFCQLESKVRLKPRRRICTSPDIAAWKAKCRPSGDANKKPKAVEVKQDHQRLSESIFKVFLKPEERIVKKKLVPVERRAEVPHRSRSPASRPPPTPPRRSRALSPRTPEEASAEDVLLIKEPASLETKNYSDSEGREDTPKTSSTQMKSVASKRSVHWEEEVTMIRRSNSSELSDWENEENKCKLINIGKDWYNCEEIPIKDESCSFSGVQFNEDTSETSFNDFARQKPTLKQSPPQEETHHKTGIKIKATKERLKMENEDRLETKRENDHTESREVSSSENIKGTKAMQIRSSGMKRRTSSPVFLYSRRSSLSIRRGESSSCLEGVRAVSSPFVTNYLTADSSSNKRGSKSEAQYQCGEKMFSDDHECPYEEISFQQGSSNLLRKAKSKGTSESYPGDDAGVTTESLRECLHTIEKLKRISSQSACTEPEHVQIIEEIQCNLLDIRQRLDGKTSSILEPNSASSNRSRDPRRLTSRFTLPKEHSFNKPEPVGPKKRKSQEIGRDITNNAQKRQIIKKQSDINILTLSVSNTSITDQRKEVFSKSKKTENAITKQSDKVSNDMRRRKSSLNALFAKIEERKAQIRKDSVELISENPDGSQLSTAENVCGEEQVIEETRKIDIKESSDSCEISIKQSIKMSMDNNAIRTPKDDLNQDLECPKTCSNDSDFVILASIESFQNADSIQNALENSELQTKNERTENILQSSVTDVISSVAETENDVPNDSINEIVLIEQTVVPMYEVMKPAGSEDFQQTLDEPCEIREEETADRDPSADMLPSNSCPPSPAEKTEEVEVDEETGRPPSRKPYFERDSDTEAAGPSCGVRQSRSRQSPQARASHSSIPVLAQEKKTPPPPRMYATLKEGGPNTESKSKVKEQIKSAIQDLNSAMKPTVRKRDPNSKSASNLRSSAAVPQTSRRLEETKIEEKRPLNNTRSRLSFDRRKERQETVVSQQVRPKTTNTLISSKPLARASLFRSKPNPESEEKTEKSLKVVSKKSESGTWKSGTSRDKTPVSPKTEKLRPQLERLRQERLSNYVPPWERVTPAAQDGAGLTDGSGRRRPSRSCSNQRWSSRESSQPSFTAPRRPVTTLSCRRQETNKHSDFKNSPGKLTVLPSKGFNARGVTMGECGGNKKRKRKLLNSSVGTSETDLKKKNGTSSSNSLMRSSSTQTVDSMSNMRINVRIKTSYSDQK